VLKFDGSAARAAGRPRFVSKKARLGMSNGDEPGEHVLQLSGPVTLYESGEVREILLGALAEGSATTTIDLETSGPWDLSGLQLLVAAEHSAARFGTVVRFTRVPTVCTEIAERSGLGGWLRDLTD
jgi:anti-anti-sigma regulatory factor